MHRLIGKWTELRTQRCNHPARQIQVTAIRITEMLLDRNHFLLADKTVPATERLCVLRGVLLVVVDITTHDVGGIFRDIQTCLKTILETHAHGVLCVNAVRGCSDTG